MEGLNELPAWKLATLLGITIPALIVLIVRDNLLQDQLEKMASQKKWPIPDEGEVVNFV